MTPRTRRSPSCFYCECGDHVWAPLTKGYVAFVSPEDAGQFGYCWSAKVSASGYVTVFRLKTVGPGIAKQVILGREVLCPPDHLMADHKDGNTLDNRRHNLRAGTRNQNAANQKVSVRNTTGVKGVGFRRGKYRAVIKVNGAKRELGLFERLEDAADAYRKAAEQHFGEFARVK